MKNFFKLVLANIVAILLLGGIFVGSIVFFLLVGSFAGNKEGYVEKGSVLVFNNETTILDSPNDEQKDIFSLGKPSNAVTIMEVLNAIKSAKSDPNISGISLEGDFVNANLTHLDNMRNALEDFKKSGKFVYAYGNTISQPAYYLGSVANSYFLNPVGGVELKGLSYEVIYTKEFAEKYGIGITVLRHGKYKSAVETYMRNDMSEENKEQLSTMLNEIWGNLSSKIATSRKLSNKQLNIIVDSLDGLLPEKALEKKLVDKMLHKSQYDEYLKTVLKKKKEEEIAKIDIRKYVSSIQENAKSAGENKIGVLYASGAIMNGKGTAGVFFENIKKDIQEIAKDESIKAVVLRINSPGGSANASDEILYELQQLRTKKPLIVSFGDYAASGGYYIAMAGDRVFSEPNTVTGSIGVFGVVPYFKEIANRNGIYAHEVSTNANSNYYSVINGMNQNATSVMTKSVENTYKQFVSHVMKNRKMSFAQVDAVGGGRVWTGKHALKVGLVDQLGSINDAIAYAAQKAKLKVYHVETFPKKRSPLEQFFKGFEEEAIASKILQKKVGKENYRLIEMLIQERKKHEIMMSLPYQITVQ